MKMDYRLCFGYRTGELLDPYNIKEEYKSGFIRDQIPFEDILSINKRVNTDSRIHTCEYYDDSDTIIDKLQMNDKVEIMGSWVHLCVTVGIIDSLLKGAVVYVDPDFTLYNRISSRDEKKEILLNSLEQCGEYTVPNHEIIVLNQDYHCEDTGTYLIFERSFDFLK